MASNKANKTISTNDCSPFLNLQQKERESLELFVSAFKQESVFNFSGKTKNSQIDFTDEPFASYDYYYEDGQKKFGWIAGRWVGQQSYNGDVISVQPRFGTTSLFPMFEEIFSINILDSKSAPSQDVNQLFQVLLPLLWAQMVGKANKYGVPRTNIDVLHKGQGIKGRLLVRKSIMPFFQEKSVVSATREKQVDATVCRIILQAYSILKKKFRYKNLLTVSDNAKDAIQSFETADIPDKRVTASDYANIQYKSIYQSWKEPVDLSWKIIQNSQNFSMNPSESKNGYSLFFDMAEIWEMYLRCLLRRNFPDWHVRSVEESEIPTYEGLFFTRKIIPDIIMERGNDIMIFDAKWKKMQFDQYDVDRTDFFQIHTYIEYFKAIGKNVIVGGLLYPISQNEFDEKQSHAPHCLGDSKTKFIVDGICFGEEKKIKEEQVGKKKKNSTENSSDPKEEKELFNTQVQVKAFIDRIRKFTN